MADIKISQLGAAATLTGTEVFPESNSGVTYKTTAQQIKDFAIGTTSITGIGDGTPTGAIKNLYDTAKDKVLVLANVACAATTGNFATINNAAITPDHIVVDVVYANPAAITSDDVTGTTSNGTLVLNGTCVSATSATIILIKKDN